MFIQAGIMEKSTFSPIVLIALILSSASLASANQGNPPSRTFAGHKGSVLCVEFSPDGKTLVSSSRDHTIKFWDMATGKLIRTLTNHTADVYSVDFSHDGRLMASGSKDTTIILWDTTTWTSIRTLHGHTAAIRETRFSADDKTLASVGEDSTFRLWDVETGKLKITQNQGFGKVKTVVFYPDGKTIATASTDGTVRLYDAQTGAQKAILKGQTQGAEYCAISPDGKQLFCGSSNIGQIIFYDAQSGKTLCDLPKAHGNQFGAEIDSGKYSPDGLWAVSGSKDRSDKFWDPRTFKLLHTITNNPGRTESMTFSADGDTLVTGFGGTDFTIKLWDVRAWKDADEKAHLAEQ